MVSDFFPVPSLVCDIPAEDGKITIGFLQCTTEAECRTEPPLIGVLLSLSAGEGQGGLFVP